MSNIQRWSLLGLAVVVLVVGYLVLRPKDDDNDPTSTSAAATQPATIADSGGATATTEAPAATQPQTDTQSQTTPTPSLPVITVKDGQPVDGVKELDFDKGATIAFKVRANAPGGEVHFHGYDVAKEIPEGGGSVTYRVPATIEGIFEVEMEDTGVQIAKVVVQP